MRAAGFHLNIDGTIATLHLPTTDRRCVPRGNQRGWVGPLANRQEAEREAARLGLEVRLCRPCALSRRRVGPC